MRRKLRNLLTGCWIANCLLNSWFLTQEEVGEVSKCQKVGRRSERCTFSGCNFKQRLEVCPIWSTCNAYGFVRKHESHSARKGGSVLNQIRAPDVPPSMANTSDSGRALCPLPLPQPRAALRTTGSFKVSPTKSRFSTDADRSEDSFSFPVPAPDSQHTQASDIAKQHRVWGAYPAITDNSLLPNPQSTISRSATSEGPPFSPPPVPPPFPSSTSRKPWQALSATRCRGSRSCGGSFISNHALNTWDQVFFEATNADLTVCTDDGSQIHVHSMVLMASSPVFKFYLQKEVRKSRFPAIDIFGVPFHAVRCFLRYLYSSRCERSDMEECALHLVVLAHTYMVPALKQTCTVHFEQGLLNTDNVVDVLQVARPSALSGSVMHLDYICCA